MEVKFSTLWASGIYKFQQIRDQNYHYLICLGVSPFSAHAWILSKPFLQKHVIGNPRFGQHRGRRASDTAWLEVDPRRSLKLLRGQSGTLDHVYRVLRNFAR